MMSAATSGRAGPHLRFGLRENLPQSSLLVVVNAFAGAMVGMERSILPAIAEHDFQLAARTAVLSFIVVFGVTNALTNYSPDASPIDSAANISRSVVRCWGSRRRWSTPTLLAVIGDVARPSWRASAVGVYRLWRDLGYAIGALFAGVTADVFGLRAAMWLIAAVTFASGPVAAMRMTETLTRRVAAGPQMHSQGA